MKVFGYMRVSSAGQVDGDGFDRQRAAIVEFCKRKEWTIVGWYQEPISGTVDGFDRPKYAEMMAVCGAGTAQTIVVEAAHRLARDLMVSELLLNEARKQGVKIFEAASGQEMTNDDDPTRVLLRQFLGAISQWDKSNMVKRLAAARARLKAKGGFMGGKIPWEEKHPVAAEHIISLRKTGYTIDEIRNFMREHGFRTPDGGKPNQWQNSTIHLIVTRLITKGKLPPLEKKQAVLDHITI